MVDFLQKLWSVLQAIPLSTVAGALSFAAALFGAAAAFSKLSADAYDKFPLGEGVLAARVRTSLKGQIDRARKSAFNRFARSTTVGALYAAGALLAAKVATRSGGFWVVAAVAGLAVSAIETLRAVRSHHEVTANKRSLEQEIEVATNQKRERELLAASIREIEARPVSEWPNHEPAARILA